MPSVVGKMTRGAVFAHLIELNALGTNAPTAKTLSADRLALDTDVAVYTVAAETGAADDIDGISGFNEGQFIILRAATGDQLTLKDENAGAASTSDRIRLPRGEAVTFNDDEAVFLYHDDTLDRWVFLGGPAPPLTHTLASHTTRSHSVLTGIAAGQHGDKSSKSIMFASPSATLAVEDWLPDQAVRVPAAGKHGTWTPGTIYVRVGTAGTGTNTILFRTSTTLTGARTTRATVNLGTAREASAAITWTPADGEYMWVAMSAVGGTAPLKGVAQVDLLEASF